MIPHRAIWLPFTVTDGLSTTENGGVNTLSGWTNALTRFAFALSSTNAPAASGISNDKFVWDLGDGTTVKSATARHVYKYPGLYDVSLYAYNSAGQEFLSTVTRQLSVANFFPDKLALKTDDIVDTINIPAGTGGSLTSPITINRHNTWQSYNALSAGGYTINLYASGSKSSKLNLKTYKTDKWSHIDQTWSFYEAITADNNTVDYSPISNIKTSVEPIYYINQLKDGTQTFTRVASSILASTSGVSAVFVGTSGSATFYYSDDTPKLEDSPVFVYASIDTSNFPSQWQLINEDYNSPHQFSNLKYFEGFGLVIPIRVRYSSGVKLSFTSTGISSMTLSNVKWQNTEIPFFINIEDKYGNFAENYPILSILPVSAAGHASSTAPYIANLSATKTETDSTLSLLSANFYRQGDSQLPAGLSGMFRGFFTSFESADDAALRTEIVVNDTPNFSKDAYLNWFVNPNRQEVYSYLSEQKYVVNDQSGFIGGSTVNRQRRTAYTHEKYSELSAGLVPISVAPEELSHTNNKIRAYIAGLTTDAITVLDTYTAHLSTIGLSSMYVQTLSGYESIPGTFSQAHNKSLIGPTSISIDRNHGVWVALSAACCVIRFEPYVAGNEYNPALQAVVTNVIPTDGKDGRLQNTTYTAHITSTVGGDDFVKSSGLAGPFNTAESTIVEADYENNVWVAYTNPISGYIQKYGTAGTDVLLLSSYEFTDNNTPTSMAADNQGNLWVATTDKYRHLAQKIDPIVDSLSASRSDGLYVYKVSNINSLSALEVNEVVEINGFENHALSTGGWLSNGLYNGTFIVESLSSAIGEFRVRPYTGRYAKTPVVTSTTQGLSTVSAIGYPSDKIYRFDKYSNKLISVSGVYKPTHIVLDKNQNVWVTHNTNTITHINTAGEITKNINVQTSDFISSYATHPTFFWTLSSERQHIGGITFDTYDNLQVINSYENKMFRIPVSNQSLSSTDIVAPDVSPISGATGFGWGNHVATGDWNGYGWINKYTNTTGIRTLTGLTTFSMYPSSGKHKIAKINEDFDPAETIKSYRFQPLLDDYHVFFDTFLGIIVGTASSEPTALGKVIYEKIANFNSNVADIDTCNIQQLYSHAKQVGINLDNYNFIYPGTLKRVMDITSIRHRKLWGNRSKFNRDFNNHHTHNRSRGKNLGTIMTTATGIISAGIPIVIKQLFNQEFRLVMPEYMELTSQFANISAGHYSSTVDMLSSYPLSAFRPQWGWNLSPGTSGTAISAEYNFYEHVPTYSDVLLEGIIDWNNPYTTLSEHNSAVDDWTKDDGTVDVILDYELRRGLGLFAKTLSASLSGVL